MRSVGSWLYRLTVNVVFLHLWGARRRSLRVLTTDDPSALERPAGGEGESDGPAVALDLERAVAGLPPGARQVFVLHDVEGYRHERSEERRVGKECGGRGAPEALMQR